MVNMGENMTRDNIREMRKMKKEIVEPNLDSQEEVKIGQTNFLPRVEETKTQANGSGAKRTAM